MISYQLPIPFGHAEPRDRRDRMRHGAYTELSIVEMQPRYDWIARRMHERGYDALDSDMAVTKLMTIVHEMRRPGARGPATLHHFHNITGVRPGREWRL
jgi:hypothetical protein